MEEPILDIRGLLDALTIIASDLGDTEGNAVYRLAAIAKRRLDEVETATAAFCAKDQGVQRPAPRRRRKPPPD